MLQNLLIAAVAAVATAQTTINVNANSIQNPSVNKKFMGCHHDYGYAQAPRGFYADMIYGSDWEAGTCSVPSWTSRLASGARGSSYLASGSSFSAKPSMALNLQAGSQIAMVNRGIGGAGMVFEAGRPYTISTWIWSGQQTTAFVELRDFTAAGGGVSLARQEFTVQTTGPAWGSTWFQYNFTLTPSASTNCTGIPFGSDPTIDCGKDAGPAYACVRCGGEFLIGLSAPGGINLGYTEMLPGTWGLVVGPNGPTRALKSGGDVLQQMGITLMRSGGSVSQSMRWKDWRGPVWNRPSIQQTWGASLLAGWGPFEVIDFCNALDIEPVVTLAYDTNDAGDWADLVEYCWGDSSTNWGQRRIDDGHPQPYNITVFELGNEQYNPNFLAQVAAMEARSKAVNSPPLRYMFPQNSGLNAADAAKALAMGLDVTRIMPDLHVQAGGAVEAAASLFNNPPVPGFNQSAINCETNANTHDQQRALDEASDLIDWFTSSTDVTNRLYARTSSFCNGASAQFDSWPQGISFFLPNMTWLQPPGWVHVMVSNTWAEQTVQATVASGPALPFAAQRTADGRTMRFMVVNDNAAATTLNINIQGAAAAGPSYTVWTLAANPSADNTPADPMAVAPSQASSPIGAGATAIQASLPAHSFVLMVVPLQ